MLELNNRLPYNTKLKERSKDFRKNMTKAEKKLWFDFLQKLDTGTYKVPPHGGGCRQAGGVIKQEENKNIFLPNIRVLKQRPIHNFIVDFYIPSFKIVIEVDGESHFTQEGMVYDDERTQILEGLGLKVVRVHNNEVLQNFEGVCEMLLKEIVK